MAVLGTIALAVVGLPLTGAVLAGRVPPDLTQFPPPLAVPISYLRFSWWAAGLIAGLLLAIVVWWGRARNPGATRQAEATAGGSPARSGARGLPWWGWLAVIWTLAWWVIAWTRWPLFSAVQRYTFFPLWLGFIVTINGWTHGLTGWSRMTRTPGAWLLLFVGSAGFWWGFEWLNRFVRNWHYLGVSEFTPVEYAVHASLCFSTVLPAVAGVADLLQSRDSWSRRWGVGPRCPWVRTPRGAIGLLAFGAAALLLTGIWPTVMYPALWSAPLALLLALDARRPNGLTVQLDRGDWRSVNAWMAAALLCGFCWELWNWHSLAKWIYTVPGIERWHVFEMPLLGYTGYLPFGLECALVVAGLGGPLQPRREERAVPNRGG